MARKVTSAPGTPAKQLAGFIARFDERHRAVIESARRVLRRRFPTANELVYDNYNFFVIGYSSTERPSDCIVSIAAGASGVSLSFYRGASLPDPGGILLGGGSQNRFVRLESAETLMQPAVRALLDAATADARTPLRATGKGKLVVRSISKNRRPRRK